MFEPGQIALCILLSILSLAFIILGEISFKLSHSMQFNQSLRRLNARIVGWTGISTQWVVSLEIGLLLSAGGLMLDLELYVIDDRDNGRKNTDSMKQPEYIEGRQATQNFEEGMKVLFSIPKHASYRG